MRPLAHRRSLSLRRGRRGATIAEYTIILFVVAVVAAVSFKIFGSKLEKGMGKTGSNFEHSSEATGQAAPQGGGAAGGSPSAAAAAGAAGKDKTDDYGGAREKPVPKEESSLFAKLAMIALGIVGVAAAFFAMMKGKHAG